MRHEILPHCPLKRPYFSDSANYEELDLGRRPNPGLDRRPQTRTQKKTVGFEPVLFDKKLKIGSPCPDDAFSGVFYIVFAIFSKHLGMFNVF